jgi:hypothetical protein
MDLVSFSIINLHVHHLGQQPENKLKEGSFRRRLTKIDRKAKLSVEM